jgi:hypothetical protein
LILILIFISLEDAEFLRLLRPTEEGLPTVEESFQFKPSSTVESNENTETEDQESLKKELEALRKLNDDNVALANELKSILQVRDNLFIICHLSIVYLGNDS